MVETVSTRMKSLTNGSQEETPWSPDGSLGYNALPDDI